MTWAFKFQGSRKDLPEAMHLSKSDKENSSNGNLVEERTENLDDVIQSDQVPTLSIHEKSAIQTGSGILSSNKVVGTKDPIELQEISNSSDREEMLISGEAGSPETRRKNVATKHGGKGSSNNVENKSFGFPRSQNNNLQKVWPVQFRI